MIIQPFNSTWWCILIAFLIIFSAETVIVRKKGLRTGKKIFKANAVILLAVFAAYKIYILFDESYNAALTANNLPTTTIWTELPLQLCDIGIFLLVIGAFTESRTVLGHCLLLNVPAAIMACVTPLCGFSGYGIFLPRVAGYYFSHWMIAFCSVSLVSFGIYYPKKEEVKKIIGLAVCIFLAVFAFSLAVRGLGLNENVNFYYAVEPIDNFVLRFFWSLIPVPGLYMLPLFVLVCIYCCLAVFLINRILRRYSSRKASRT